MARTKKAADPIEESIRLSSKVTIVIHADPDAYDTLDIQRVGGVVTIALPGTVARFAAFAPMAAPPSPGEYVPPAGTPNIDAARAALEAQFGKGPAAPVATTQRDVVSPASLGLPSAEELGLIGPGAGEFVGRSNEDVDA